MIVIGELSLWVGLILATWSAAVSLTGASLGRRDLMESGERAIYMTLLMLSLACAGLWVALFTHEFSITHVASFSSRNLPSLFLVAAVWAGRTGGMLFAGVCLAIVSTVIVLTSQGRAYLPRVTATLGIALALSLLTLCFVANPFARLDWIPQEGQGMPPHLQNVWASLYPPILYAGGGTLGVPVAIWIGARTHKRVDSHTVTLIRKWALLPWIITTCAVVAGIREAYTVVDVNASFLFDPIRNGSIMPWLVVVGLLVLVMRRESHSEERSMRTRSNKVGSYVTILGMLLTIAGIAGREFRELAGLTLTPGASAQLLDPFGKRWSIENLGISRYDVLNRQVTAIAIEVSIDGQSSGIVSSEMRQHIDSRGAPVHRPATTTGVKGTWPLDLMVSLDDVDPGEAARLRVAFNPLIRLIWIGGILVMLGGCMIIYPASRTKS